MQPPTSEQEWKRIAAGFETDWNFPNCLGALDGKHVAMECPNGGGSTYCNYKGFHSLVLMAICDENYCFSFVDIGGYGHDNDASIFGDSEICMAIEANQLEIPCAEIVNGFTLPYVLVADEIFPLKPCLMKPFGGKKLDEKQEIYNYRLSRCRKTIENAFGIFAAKWRIFRRPIRAYPETVEKIIKACVCLHNYLKQTDNACYVPSGFIDAEDSTGNVIPGGWRSVVADDQSAMQNIQRAGSNNYSKDAKAIRESFKDFFNSSGGSVPWQYKHVRSCGETMQ